MHRRSLFFVIFAAILGFAGTALAQADRSQFWQQQRKGANCFNTSVDRRYFTDAHAAGIRVIRLTWSKWKGKGRDFLIGDADQFNGIPKADLAQLRRVLDDAHAEGISVILAPLSLPGLRWRQQNGMKFDDRLWRDAKYHEQSAAFWRELAGAMKDHPAVVAYNLINEPAPARSLKVELTDRASREAFEKRVAGTPSDVNVLYSTLVKAVRAVDATTPIMLDSCDFASADAFEWLKPVEDASAIYAVHCYEPWNFTNFKTNGGKQTYPGIKVVRAHLSQVDAWAKQHNLPPTRIMLAEFGCDRRIPGSDQYLDDVIKLANDFGWHWAFYAYREDEWDAMDYELGTGKLPWAYWQAIERGEKPVVPRKDNPLWRVIANQFAP